MKRIIGICGVLITVAFPSMAQNWWDQVRLGTPAYNGTGCPANTAAVALAPDASSLSILFDRYVATAGGNTGRRADRKTCNIAVPVHVPQGFSVSIFNIDYRGFNNLPYGAYSLFDVEYFFAGTRGPSYRKRFDGRLQADYLLRNTLQAGSIVWSPCGEQVILRANSSMFVNTNARYEEAYSSVDSVDVTAGLIYHLRWRQC